MKSGDYSPPSFLFNSHLETIFPAVFRRVRLNYERERLKTPDEDFLDLDWVKTGSKKIVVIQHGLEGNSLRAYVKGMAKIFSENGFDALAWNYRGCSGEMSNVLRFYHSGETDDLRFVIDYLISKGYEEIYPIGFSLGGNMTLKFLGERSLPSEVKAGVAFSVPLHLLSSCEKLSRASNWIYSNRFVRSLKKKVAAKSRVAPSLEVNGLSKIKSLLEFDDTYTAPLHGFKNAHDYYERCSAINFIRGIKVPTLIVNTKNDPFLSNQCYPEELLRGHPYVKLEMPSRGGHVGFSQFNKNGVYWSEQRALNWVINGC